MTEVLDEEKADDDAPALPKLPEEYPADRGLRRIEDSKRLK